MDILGILRSLGSLAVILGMLAGALWAVRRFDIRLPGRTGVRNEKRLQLVERLGIDQRRSVVIIRRDGREHLMVMGPEGSVTIESFDAPANPPQAPERPAMRTSRNFAELLKDDVIDWAVAKRCSRAGSARRNP